MFLSPLCVSDIKEHRQTAALKGLPLHLYDSYEKLFRNCSNCKHQLCSLTLLLTVLAARLTLDVFLYSNQWHQLVWDCFHLHVYVIRAKYSP